VYLILSLSLSLSLSASRSDAHRVSPLRLSNYNRANCDVRQEATPRKIRLMCVRVREKPAAVTFYAIALPRYRSDGRRCTPAERSCSNNRSFVCTYCELAVFSRRGCVCHAPVRGAAFVLKGADQLIRLCAWTFNNNNNRNNRAIRYSACTNFKLLFSLNKVSRY